MSQALTVRDIAAAIEDFAPKSLQESYDNAGLQVGNPDATVSGILLCLDVTEDIVCEAEERKCNLIVSHHPLLFKGLKEITGTTPAQRIVIEALRLGISIYSAHTNLDSAREGVSYEIAHILGLKSLSPLEPRSGSPEEGLGIVGDIDPIPAMEFLRKLKDRFDVKCLRYSARSPQLVIRRVAVCGGAGASIITNAMALGADVIVTGDVKYHTALEAEICLLDVGHHSLEEEMMRRMSELLARRRAGLNVVFVPSASPLRPALLS